MSKIGRKPIEIGNVKIDIHGKEVHYKGPKSSGVYVVPEELDIQLEGNTLSLTTTQGDLSDIRRVWGLHRALLANCIKGASVEFEKLLVIEGLGYKAALSGNKVVLNLGYTHKIDFELPEGVSLELDKTGQKLTFKSSDKALVGHVCSKIRALRPPEPYKGTGVRYADEVIIRKAGKTKAS
jgi:large subunit ribosomal protein L6